VIIIDDEPSYVELASLALTEHLDCPIFGFTRPQDALASLADTHPAVIVTDYYMPQMNGIDFARAALAAVPDASLILISGHNLELEGVRVSELPSLKRHFQKPFSWRELVDAVVQAWPAAEQPPGRTVPDTQSTTMPT
jgi:DNA-binding NtrC family response regulator